MKNDATIEVIEVGSKVSKRKLAVLGSLAVAGVVGIAAFALSVANRGETENV